MLLTRAGAAPLLLAALAALAGGPPRAQADEPAGGPPAEEPAPAPPPGPEAGDAGVDPGEVEAGHGSFEFRLGYYHNDDSDEANPFLDEAETVVEPVIVVDYQVTERLGLTGTLSYDDVSSASIDRLSRYPEQSGASGDFYVGGDVAARYAVSEDVRVGAHAGASVEYDYRSFGLGADVKVDLAERCTTLSLGLTAFFDSVDVIRFDGEQEGQDDRISLTLNLGWYQVLTPTLHLDLGYTFAHQSGFLETAYNSVVVEDPTLPPNPALEGNARGLEVHEELPDTRLRHAITAELRKYLDTGTSLGALTRLYADSWGVESVSLEGRVYQWLVDERLRVRLRYRFYWQCGASAFDRHVRAPPGRGRDLARALEQLDRTQDADLGTFRSHTLGLKVTFSPAEGHAIDLSLDYVLRSDGLDQVVLALGWRVAF